MSAISELGSASHRTVQGNSCNSKIALAIHGGSASPAVDSTGTITFAIDGVYKTHAALSNQSLAPTHMFNGKTVGGANPAAYVQPAGTTVYYLVCVNIAGTLAVVQGSYLGQQISFPSDLSVILTGEGGCPVEPAGYTAIGMIKVVTAGAATFTPGTTNLDAANVTSTFYDLERVPSVAP